MAKQESHRRLSDGQFALIAIGIALVVAGVGVGVVSAQNSPRFPKQTMIGKHSVADLTYTQALDLISRATDALLEKGLEVKDDERTAALLPTVGAGDEFSYDLYGIDAEATVQQAYAATHPTSAWQRTWQGIRSWFVPVKFPMTVTYDAAAMDKALHDTFAEDEQPAVNSSFQIELADDDVAVAQELSGTKFDFDGAVAGLRERLRNLDDAVYTLATLVDQPTVTAAQAQGLVSSVRAALARAPFTITAKGKSFAVTDKDLAEALIPAASGTSVVLAVDADALEDVFDEVAAVTDVAVQEGRFRLEGTRVVEFENSQDGITLDRVKTAAALSSVLLSGNKTVAALVTEAKPQFSTGDANTFGISQLVAEGKTSFAGSPVNRRFNIKVGADKLNGLLIQPGLEFSLIKALTPIDGANGYRQELVIKGDRTVPEYGGGLCQIGTTLFRAVLNAGLPVLERKNHSYRVSYYEPPVGMDATIYDPKPDFRFKNDYDTTLLLQTKIVGDDLIFQFYGTKDGRKAESSKPRVFNFRSPPAKKLIETDTLAPGVTRCIERAHVGSDAEFTYTVTSATGEVKKTVFTSHYRPWGEVCLVGKKPAADTD